MKVIAPMITPTTTPDCSPAIVRPTAYSTARMKHTMAWPRANPASVRSTSRIWARIVSAEARGSQLSMRAIRRSQSRSM